jgi:hypothetical protein
VINSPDADYKERLEEIAAMHLVPDPAQKADVILRSHDLVGHQRVYDLDKLKADAAAAGLKILHVQGFVLKILSAAMMAGFPLALTKAMADLRDELPPEILADGGLVLEF